MKGSTTNRLAQRSAITGILFAAAWLCFCLSIRASTGGAGHSYPSQFPFAAKIGNDLYENLDAKLQKGLDANPLSLETMDAPMITPIVKSADGRITGEVAVSAGMIDLINHLAHAKAIDHIQPGYFDQYVANLARSGGDNLPSPPDMVDPRFWTDAVMNDQASYFNQMIGMTVAINLSHHYLGHFTKYANQMLAGKLVPINNFISPAEWEATMKAATRNALDGAYGTDGARALFEAIDKIPQRPPWTAFIAPTTVDLKKLSKTLKKYENDYFHGGIK